MLRKENIYYLILFLFVTSAVFWGNQVEISTNDLFIALFLFTLLTVFNYHLNIQSEIKGVATEYSINYGIAIAIYAGPVGVFLYEILNHVSSLLINIWKKKTNDKPYLYTFYNIVTFSAANIIAYYLYEKLWPVAAHIPFGIWVTFILISVGAAFISDTIILVYFWLIKEIKSWKDAYQFYNYWNLLDIGKTVLTNGLLFVFLQQQEWEYLIGLLVLNYFVNRSIIMKTINIQDKLERDKFETMAYKDALTGANNRAFMDKKIKELSNLEQPMGIVVADIDRFKLINDTYNHAIGDKVLKYYVKFLTGFLKEDDYLFRSGGEEFTLFLRNRTYQETLDLLEEIRQELENTKLDIEFNEGNHIIAFTSSFGLYFNNFHEISSIEKGYIYADNLLLKSKHLGRNRITGENGIDENSNGKGN
ncbi:GGDEF domain-containing protein [Mesobacillus jeotgali]|uniref:GGDEF domain-containing protein n=1 Tax=Mesobacillus jeotgali TaxID=129985 RepID=UPI0009A6BA28|nr:GGDEF domain-containing protein [Mesobacillus jeotgali]